MNLSDRLVREKVYNLDLGAEGFLHGSAVKNLPAMQETQEMRVSSLGWEDPLAEEMATHSGILAWNIPWTEEPSGLQSKRISKSQTRLSN